MARNIEIKARVRDRDALAAKAVSIAAEGPIQIAQSDTFFSCESGRLKLRTFSDGTGELIFYRRANECGPKESFYVRSPTAAPGLLRQALSLAYGEIGSVIKQRTLYLVGRTRLHLDSVENLGQFLELEVVLDDDEQAASGVQEAYDLMRELGVAPEQLVDCAYIDLLLHREV
jgi:predicted adenylyl cyclase CyaB